MKTILSLRVLRADCGEVAALTCETEPATAQADAVVVDGVRLPVLRRVVVPPAVMLLELEDMELRDGDAFAAALARVEREGFRRLYARPGVSPEIKCFYNAGTAANPDWRPSGLAGGCAREETASRTGQRDPCGGED